MRYDDQGSVDLTVCFFISKCLAAAEVKDFGVRSREFHWSVVTS